MVDRDQLQLIDIGDLAQLFGDADAVFAIHGHERFAGDLNVLVVIDREVLAVAGTRAERSDAQHVRDVLELAAIPGPDDRAGSGQALRFLVLVTSCRRPA